MKKAGSTDMGLNTLRYYFRETFHSLIRNNWLSLASISTVAISLLILGCSLLLVLNANKIVDALESMLEINVFLENDLEEQTVRLLGEKIRSLPGISSIEFVSKEEAWQNLRKSFGEHSSLLESLDDNPLPDAFRVKTKRAEQVPEIARNISRLSGVEEVLYGQGWVEKLLVVIHWIRLAGVIIVVILVAAAIFLVSTTIRISVYSRRKEIGVMKYLGATNWFVRFPFLLEGMVLGLSGSLVAAVIIYYGYISLLRQINLIMPFIPLVKDVSTFLPILAGLIGLGLVIGAAGSTISVHRFLKV